MNVLARGAAGLLDLIGAILIAAAMAKDVDQQNNNGTVVHLVGVLAFLSVTTAALFKFAFTIVDIYVEKSNEENDEEDKLKMTSDDIDKGTEICDKLLKIVEHLIKIA